MEDEFPARGSRVDLFSEALKANPPCFQRFYSFNQLLNRTSKSVEFPNNKRVSRPHELQRGDQLWAVLLGSRCLFNEKPFAAAGLQCNALQFRVLLLSGHPRVTDQHALKPLKNALRSAYERLSFEQQF